MLCLMRCMVCTLDISINESEANLCKSSLIFSRSGSNKCMSLSGVGSVDALLLNGSPVSVETSNCADDASSEAATTSICFFLCRL